MKQFAIGLILDQDKDDDINDNSTIKILGFNILNLPDFTEEILLFNDMQNRDENELNGLGLDMFYKAKAAHLVIEHRELKHSILTYDNADIHPDIINIPINIGVCKDIDNNILFGIESYDLDKTHDKIITKSKYQKNTHI